MRAPRAQRQPCHSRAPIRRRAARAMARTKQPTRSHATSEHQKLSASATRRAGAIKSTRSQGTCEHHCHGALATQPYGKRAPSAGRAATSFASTKRRARPSHYASGYQDMNAQPFNRRAPSCRRVSHSTREHQAPCAEPGTRRAPRATRGATLVARTKRHARQPCNPASTKLSAQPLRKRASREKRRCRHPEFGFCQTEFFRFDPSHYLSEHQEMSAQPRRTRAPATWRVGFALQTKGAD